MVYEAGSEHRASHWLSLTALAQVSLANLLTLEGCRPLGFQTSEFHGKK